MDALLRGLPQLGWLVVIRRCCWAGQCTHRRSARPPAPCSLPLQVPAANLRLPFFVGHGSVDNLIPPVIASTTQARRIAAHAAVMDAVANGARPALPHTAALRRPAARAPAPAQHVPACGCAARFGNACRKCWTAWAAAMSSSTCGCTVIGSLQALPPVLPPLPHGWGLAAAWRAAAAQPWVGSR